MKKEGRIDIIRWIPQWFCGIAILITLVIVIIVMRNHPSDVPTAENNVKKFQTMWVETGANQTEQEITLPFAPSGEAGTSFTIKGTIPSDVEEGHVVCLRPDQADMRVYVDGELRTEYATEKSAILGKVSPRRYIFLELKDEDRGKDIEIEMTHTVANVGSIDVLKYGYHADIINDMILDNSADMMIATVMLIVCLICLAASIILTVAFGHFFEILHLTIMGIMASVWILCNSEISQLYFPNVSVSMMVDYIMLMLLPFPFLFFMNRVQGERYDKVYRVFEYLTVATTITFSVLQILGIRDLFQMFPFIAGVFGASLIMILVTIVIDCFFKRSCDYRIVAIGIVAAIMATLIQFLLFSLKLYKFGGHAVAVALLILLFTTIVDTARKVKQMEADKQAALAESKAEGNFLANMSHEIRTPINAVLGMNEMIIREAKDEQIREYAENIENSGNMLLSIVNDILDFSKIRSGKMKIVPEEYTLTELVRNMTEMIEPRAKDKGLKFEVDLPEDLPNCIYGDELRIKQILINLLGNAVKYTIAGRVKLAISAKDWTEPDGFTLVLQVIDSGRGIREEDQEDIFNAFSRVDEAATRTIEGTGLGLALVHRLTQSMEGTISLDSQINRGSIFTVELPQKRLVGPTVGQVMKEKKAPERQNSVAAFTAPTAKVLVVDDTSMNLVVMRGLLKRTKVQVITADSAQQGIECMRNTEFDIAFIDYLMPGMDGEAMLKQVREENIAPHTPMIALTANAIAGAKELYLGMGFDDYIAKPVKPIELEETMMKLIPAEKIIEVN